jgi:hypothetical protein
MNKKIVIIEKCTQCKLCEWIGGKPHCTHEEMPKVPLDKNDSDWVQYPGCFTDGTRPILDGCPLGDYNGSD